MFSRILAGSRISLTIGLVGVLITFLLGTLLGGYSGFYGGIVDVVIMRLTEILGAIPKIPLWIALAAIVPMDWPVILTYFTIKFIILPLKPRKSPNEVIITFLIDVLAIINVSLC